MTLEMAGGDPLRAQEIEEKLTRRWAERWLAWAAARADAAKKATGKGQAEADEAAEYSRAAGYSRAD